MTKREKFRICNKEDLKYFLEELWNLNLDKTFYKIVSREAKRYLFQLLTIPTDELLDLTWREHDCSLSTILASEVYKIFLLLNLSCRHKEKGHISNFSKLQQTSITLNTWTRFVTHREQQMLVDYCDIFFHNKAMSEDPESLIPKKYHFPKTHKNTSFPRSLSSFPDHCLDLRIVKIVLIIKSMKRLIFILLKRMASV